MSNNKIIKISEMGSIWATLDPFLFSVHHLDFFPAGNEEMGPKVGIEGRNIGQDFSNKDGWSMYHGKKIPGFPYHPHRGFETITIVEQGFADHSDSLGAKGRFGKGDVQWMTAGKGVQHSEMFPLINQNESNTLELFQIWLNLPKAKKHVDPNYQMLWSEEIPVAEEKDDRGKLIQVKAIAGNFRNYKALTPPPNSWASNQENHLAIWLVKMEAGAKWLLPKSVDGLNKALYFYNGDFLKVENENVRRYHSIQVNPMKEITLEAGDKSVDFLLLQAKPINEPVVQHGPFVMNTQEEISQTFRDYQTTEFGGWPWPEKEIVHGREQGRFAQYPNGKREEK